MKRYVALFIIMVLLTCGINAIPIKADKTDTSNIIYNNIIFKITDDMDVNAERTVITSLVDKNGNEFKFAGLSAGEYTLEETTVPDKYNKLDTINFTIYSEQQTEIKTRYALTDNRWITFLWNKIIKIGG